MSLCKAIPKAAEQVRGIYCKPSSQRMAELVKSEKKLRAREASLGSRPKTKVDFERALMTSPNSSCLWIQYAVNRIEKESPAAGRAILLQAIKQISIDEEREKLNLYFAWLNYEDYYGTEDSFDEAYEAALGANDPEKVMHHRIRKCISKGHIDTAEETHELLCRRFGSNAKNWSLYLDFLLTHIKDVEKAEQVCKRGKQALEDTAGNLERIFAVSLFRSGYIERGRTLLEHLISLRPKRGDLWNLYIDMEMKYGSAESQRELYERALTLPFSKNTIRGFFKRYISFEAEHGEGEKVEEIKRRARRYVQENYGE